TRTACTCAASATTLLTKAGGSVAIRSAMLAASISTAMRATIRSTELVQILTKAGQSSTVVQRLSRETLRFDDVHAVVLQHGEERIHGARVEVTPGLLAEIFLDFSLGPALSVGPIGSQ